jgi:hypothetical protein
MAKIETAANELIIRVPLNVRPVPSGSGKSNVIDSTRGFVKVSTPFGQVSVGLNVITTDDAYGKVTPSGKPVPPTLVKASGK